MPSTVIYISEITHPSLRGRMGCIPSLLLALGRFTSKYILCLPVCVQYTSKWLNQSGPNFGWDLT